MECFFSVQISNKIYGGHFDVIAHWNDKTNDRHSRICFFFFKTLFKYGLYAIPFPFHGSILQGILFKKKN